jgi:hypothetical protein
MFEQVIRLFSRVKTEAAYLLTVRKKAAPVRKEPLKVLPAGPDITRLAELNAPETLLLPSMEPEPVAVSKPAADRNISMPLPSSISGEEVAMVQHAVKKTSTERFKYVEKPLRPLEKVEHKKPEDVIKYKIKPLTMQSQAEHKDATRSDVIVYGEKTRN